MPTTNKKIARLFFFFKIILAGSLLILNFGLALADQTCISCPSGGSSTPAPAPDTSGQNLDRGQYSTFPVNKYLTIQQSTTDNKTVQGGSAGVTQGVQGQSYLVDSSGKPSGNPVASLILQAINFIALTSASLSFLAVVVAGFMMMSSAGNENQRTKGIEILTKAIIGLVITLSAYFIVAFVQNLLFETAPK